MERAINNIVLTFLIRSFIIWLLLSSLLQQSKRVKYGWITQLEECSQLFEGNDCVSAMYTTWHSVGT